MVVAQWVMEPKIREWIIYAPIGDEEEDEELKGVDSDCAHDSAEIGDDD